MQRNVFVDGKRTVSVERRLCLSYDCNQRCAFCQVRENGPALSWEEIVQALKDLAPRNDRERKQSYLVLTGGEPTISPYFFRALQEAERSGFTVVSVQTNGVRFSDPAFVERLHRFDIVKAITFSLHATTARTYDRLTGTRGQLPLALKGIRNALRYPFKCVFNMVITRENYRQVPAHVEVLAKLARGSAGKVTFLPSVIVDTAANPCTQQLGVRYSSLVPYLAKALRAHPELFEPLAGDCLFPPCTTGVHLPSFVRLFTLRADRPVRYVTPGEPIPETTDMLKLTRCTRCVYDAVCNGVSVYYAREFGMDELSPVADKKR